MFQGSIATFKAYYLQMVKRYLVLESDGKESQQYKNFGRHTTQK
jgi:hypothetical protein